MITTTINLNTYIIVALTPRAIKIAIDNNFINLLNINSDGYCEIQLREFMNRFGSYLFVGAKNIVSNNEIEIIFDEK